QRSDIPASAPPPPVNQIRREELVQVRKTLIESQQETFLELEPESTDSANEPSMAAGKRKRVALDTSTATRSFRISARSSSRDADSPQIEELIPTASKLTRAGSNCANGSIQRFAPEKAAPLVICSFPDYTEVHAEGCESPYRTDTAVTATVYPLGVKLTGERTAFQLRCERGRWFNVALPVPATID
ncbi:MAG: hypothetical protein O7F71_07875, partial [Gammaproteobacteria bacterium]|nr:hypothetical protein [Gammaproteobacteria bacterium]